MTRTFAGNLLGSEQYHIQLNNRSVKDRSFSRKIESEWSFFIPLKRIFIKTFWRADSMCSRTDEDKAGAKSFGIL